MPGAEGYFGVLPGHTPLLAALAVGEMWYRKGTEKTYLVAGLRLRRSAAGSRHDPGADRRARRGDRRRPRRGGAQARAEERLAAQPASDIDYERARVALAKSLSRLQVSSRIGVSADRRARTGADARLTTHERHASAVVQLGRYDGPGLRRTSNEDSYCARPDLGLFVVADGMGGHVAGEVASRVAVDTIEAFIDDTASADKNRTWPFPFEPGISLEANRLKAAFRLANRADRRRRSPIRRDLRGMATTAVGAARSAPSVGLRRARRRQPRLPAARRRARPAHPRSLVGRGAGAGRRR